MEALLLQNVPGKGKIGDTIRVKDGYFRNFLQPRGLAVTASDANRRHLEETKRQLQRKAAKELSDSQALAMELAKVTLTFQLKAGDSDRLFGSVTNADIADALAAQGFDIDRRKIIMDEPIKTLGMFTVHAHLRSDVEAKIKVLVEKKI